MKQEVNDIIKWGTDLITKYGILVFIGLALWLGLKKAWFWIIMPIFALIFLKQIAILCDIEIVSKISVSGLVVSWIFIFSLLKGLGGLLFERG